MTTDPFSTVADLPDFDIEFPESYDPETDTGRFYDPDAVEVDDDDDFDYARDMEDDDFYYTEDGDYVDCEDDEIAWVD